MSEPYFYFRQIIPMNNSLSGLTGNSGRFSGSPVSFGAWVRLRIVGIAFAAFVRFAGAVPKSGSGRRNSIPYSGSGEFNVFRLRNRFHRIYEYYSFPRIRPLFFAAKIARFPLFCSRKIPFSESEPARKIPCRSAFVCRPVFFLLFYLQFFAVGSKII